MSKKGLELEGTFDHAVIGIVDCHTEIPAEGWTHLHVVPAGYAVDNEAHNEAIGNAESFGYEDCECGDEDCEACSNDRGSMENVCGIFYKYWPSESGIFVNGGDPQTDIINACMDNDAIVVDSDSLIIELYLSKLVQLLHMPEETRSEDLEYLTSGLSKYARQGYKIRIVS